MRIAPRTATAWLGLWVLAFGSLSAQRPHRSGLWFELCNGPAFVRVASSEPATVTTKTGIGSCVRLGGTLSDKVFLGVEAFDFLDETFGFVSQDTSLVAENEALTALVLWYPGRSGFFLKAGVGVAEGTFTVRTSPSEDVKANGTGVGLTFGIGYDVPISRKFALTANLEAVITAIGDYVLPSGRVDDVIATIYHAGLGIAIR